MSFGQGCVISLGIICLFGMAGLLVTRGPDMEASELAIVASTLAILSNGITGAFAFIMGKEVGKKDKET